MAGVQIRRWWFGSGPRHFYFSSQISLVPFGPECFCLRLAWRRGTGLVTLCQTPWNHYVFAVHDVVVPVWLRCARHRFNGVFDTLCQTSWHRSGYALQDIVSPLCLRCARHRGTSFFSLCMTSWHRSGYAVPGIVAPACLRCARHRGTGLFTLCDCVNFYAVAAQPGVTSPSLNFIVCLIFKFCCSYCKFPPRGL